MLLPAPWCYFAATGITRVNLDGAAVSRLSSGNNRRRQLCLWRSSEQAITAGQGDDTITFGATGTLTNADVVNGGAGTDTIAIANTSNNDITAVVDLQDVTNVEGCDDGR